MTAPYLPPLELGKWPRLLVAGDPVTEEQANEIILRTTDWWLNTNDVAWDRTVRALVGLVDPAGPMTLRGRPVWLGVHSLNLHYLANHRIASTWVGGPHGWCDWDGTIGCATYNLGKWPDRAAVTEEWRMVAAAFPFLRLRAQLVPDEGEAGRAAAEWRVTDGVAEVCEPTGLIVEPADLDYDQVAASLLRGDRERGVSAARLLEAFKQVSAAFNPDR